MAINKNFVVKNGLEVNTDQIFADSTSGKVGIGSTLPTVELDVTGAIAATDVTSSLLRVTGYSTLPQVTVNDDLSVLGFTTLTNELNVLGISSLSNTRFVGVSTFENNVNLDGNVNVTGFSTFVGLTSVVGNFKVSGITTFSNITNVSTLGAVGGVVAVGSGKSLTSFDAVVPNESGLNVTGVVTATSFSGSFSGTGIAIGVQSAGTVVSTATSTINFSGSNNTITVESSDGVSGITTVNIASGGISLGLAIALGA